MALRTVRENIFIALSHQVVMLCYSSHRKLMPGEAWASMQGFGALSSLMVGDPLGKWPVGVPQMQPGSSLIGPSALTRENHPGDSKCRMYTCSGPTLCPALGSNLPLPRRAPWELRSRSLPWSPVWPPGCQRERKFPGVMSLNWFRY